MANDSVGQLTLDVGIEERTIQDLMGQLEKLRKVAQTTLDARQALGLEDALTNTTKAAKGVTTELTASQKAIKTYAANVREAVALEKSGLSTREATVKTIRSLTGEIKGQLGTLDKLGSEHRELAKAMGDAGTAAIRLETAQTRANKAFQDEQVRQYRDAVTSLRTEFERGATSRDDFIRDTERLQTEMVELRSTLPQTSKAFGQLDRVIGTSARGIQTAEGNISKLGLSQQVALGYTRNLGTGFNNLGMAITPLLGGLGLAGLVKVAGNWASEAQRAEAAAVLFDKSIERFGLNAGEANELVGRLSGQFGVLPSTVQSAATVMLRAGASLEDVEKALTAAGASAAASGFDISTAFDNVGAAVATGRSELLESSGIITNASTAYEAYAKQVGVSVDELTQAQKVQALSNAIFEESRFEIEDLSSVMTDQVKAQQNFRTAMAEARRELGQQFAPTLTAGANAAAALLKGFEGIPESAQASVLGIGGITAGVTVLGGVLSGLRLALLPLFAPPAGLIIGGAAAAAALGVALYNLVQNVRNAKTPTEEFADSLEQARAAVSGAGDKEALLTALEGFSEHLSTTGKEAVDKYAERVRAATGDFTALTTEVVNGLEEISRKELELQKKALQRQINIQVKLSTPTETDVDAQVQELEDRINRSADQQARGFMIDLGIEFDETLGRKTVKVLNDVGTIGAEAATQIHNLGTELFNVSERSDVGPLMDELAEVDAALIQMDADAKVREETPLVPPVPPATTTSITTAAEETQTYLDKLREAGPLLTDFSTRLQNTDLKLDLEEIDPAEAVDRFRFIAEQAGRAAAEALAQGKTERAEAFIGIRDEAEAQLESVIGVVREQANEAAKSFQPAEQGANNFITSLDQLRTKGVNASFDDLIRSILDSGDAYGRAGDALGTYSGAARQSLIDAENLRIEQINATNAGEDYVNSIIANSKAFGENYQNSEALRESFDLMAGGTRLLGDEFENLATVSGEVALPIPEVTAELEDYVTTFQKDLPDALERSAETAALFGEDFNGVATEAELVRAEIESLLERGLKPNDKAVQDLSERYLELQGELEATQKANENYAKRQEEVNDVISALADASGIATEDIDELIASLDKAAEDMGILGEQARQAQADLEALSVARDIAGLFDVLAESARYALENIPGLSDEASGALSALADAGDAAMEALQDGTFSTQDAVGVLGGGVDGLAEAFRDDLSPAAYAGVKALDGVVDSVSKFASGDVVGGTIALVETAIGAVADFFGESAREAEEARIKAEQLKEAYRELYDLMIDLNAEIADAEQASLQTDLDLAEETGDFDTKAEKYQLLLAQTQIDLIEAANDFDATMRDIQEREDETFDALMATGEYTPQEARAEAERRVQPLRDAAINTYEGAVALITDEAADAAKKLGVSNEQFYADMTVPSGLLENITVEQRLALLRSLKALDANVDIFAGTLNTAGTNISTAGQSMGTTASVGVQGGVSAISSTMSSAFGNLVSELGGKSGILGGTLTRQGGVLSSGFADFFGRQRSATDTEAELTRQKLQADLDRIRAEFQASVSGGGGLTATIGRGQTDVAGALETFFGGQRSTIGTEVSRTVGRIDDAAADVREAMGRLIAASTAGRAAANASSSWLGGGGGGSSGPAGLFAPLSSYVDERALSGMGDEFGSFQTRANSIISDIEGAGSSFGYGHAMSAIRPVGDNYSGGRKAGPLSGLLESVRRGVEAYKEGFVSSVNSASETTARGFQALGYNFRKGIEEESRRNRAKVKEQAKTTKELRDEFIAAFDLVGGSTLLKKIGGPRSGLYDFALQIGQAIESGFRSGVEGGAKAFLDGTGTMLETLQRDAFDQLAFGTIQKLLNSGLVEKLLGGVYTDFAAALAGGDTNNAIAAFQKVIAKLPSVAGQLEAILAPIKGIGNSLGYGAQAPEVENLAQGIRLEARSLGSATPDWAIRFGQAADLISRAADVQFKASEKFAAAVARFDKGGGKLEARKPNKLTKF